MYIQFFLVQLYTAKDNQEKEILKFTGTVWQDYYERFKNCFCQIFRQLGGLGTVGNIVSVEVIPKGPTQHQNAFQSREGESIKQNIFSSLNFCLSPILYLGEKEERIMSFSFCGSGFHLERTKGSQGRGRTPHYLEDMLRASPSGQSDCGLIIAILRSQIYKLSGIPLASQEQRMTQEVHAPSGLHTVLTGPPG